MYMFFDTETNGLPKKMNASPGELHNWPRIIQLAYVVLDNDFNEIESFCQLIRPDGWTIPNEKFWIDNGYSTALNEAHGVPAKFALNMLAITMSQCHTMVAHNLAFDTPIVQSEMIRYGIRPATSPQTRICTMKSTVDLCRLPKKSGGGYKCPKLEELHEKLFGVKFDNAHDALADVRATVRCYIELKQNGLL